MTIDSPGGPGAAQQHEGHGQPAQPPPVKPKLLHLVRQAIRIRLQPTNRASLRALDPALHRAAGPCGYALQRWIQEAGAICVVVAPSLIPRKPGDRIKTDRRDARKLGELYRAGLLTEVHPPTPEDEAVRDLCRAREDAHQDLVRSQHRLSKLLLRRGWMWTGGKKNWSQGHRLWLRSLRFEHEPDQVVFDDDLLAIERLVAEPDFVRRLALDLPHHPPNRCCIVRQTATPRASSPPAAASPR